MLSSLSNFAPSHKGVLYDKKVFIVFVPVLQRRKESDLDGNGKREEGDPLHEQAQHVLPHEVVGEPIGTNRFQSLKQELQRLS